MTSILCFLSILYTLTTHTFASSCFSLSFLLSFECYYYNCINIFPYEIFALRFSHFFFYPNNNGIHILSNPWNQISLFFLNSFKYLSFAETKIPTFIPAAVVLALDAENLCVEDEWRWTIVLSWLQYLGSFRVSCWIFCQVLLQVLLLHELHINVGIQLVRK